jgi:hypothetical protein
MRNFFILLLASMMFACVVPAIAQDVGDPGGDLESVLNLTTFAGIVAIISYVGTQISKLIPVIAEKSILKIAVSIGLGVLISYVAYVFGWADFLAELTWWQVLLQGVLAGASASGLYDLIKNVLNQKEDV